MPVVVLWDARDHRNHCLALMATTIAGLPLAVSGRCVHFVGFKSLADQRMANAQAVFGPPDFLHRRWDQRAQREIGRFDLVVFADGEADQVASCYNGDDEAYQ